MTIRPFRSLYMTLAMLATAALPAAAQTVMVGNNNTGNNCIPFGCGGLTTNIPGYQQVFSSSLFSQMVAISEFDFFVAGGASIAGGTFNVYLGYTNAAVGALSSNLASNPSGPMTFFASLAGGGAAPATLAIVGGPFVYDPTQGNLLLEIDNASWTQGSSQFEASMTPFCSRALNSTFNGGSANVADNACLDTEIHFSPAGVVGTPEPSTVVLMASGLVGLVGVARRRRVKGTAWVRRPAA